METSAGDLTVYIASNVKVTIDAAIDSAFGHKINSDFPEVRITSDGGDWGPRELYAKGNLNGGGPVLKLRASTGNINIRRDKQ